MCAKSVTIRPAGSERCRRLRVRVANDGEQAVSDGAAAATAAERYISEMNDFRSNVLESAVPTLLDFWNPEIPGSLELLNQLREENERSVQPHKFMELDATRKKGLALVGVHIDAVDFAVQHIVGLQGDLLYLMIFSNDTAAVG